MTEDPDDVLVARCRGDGDERAFAELVRRHREAVFRLAVSILGRQFVSEAEEVTQEVFVRVHHSLGTFRGESQFGSWVYRIAFNHALNVKARVRFRIPHLNEAVLSSVASPDADPHEQLARAQRLRALDGCLSELPDVYQSALRLHYWLGASVTDIATLVGVPENTVKSYLHRGRRLLRVMLQERGYEV